MKKTILFAVLALAFVAVPVFAEQVVTNTTSQEVVQGEPCEDYYSDTVVLRARGVAEDYEQQLAAEMARAAAVDELSQQISSAVQSMLTNYKKSVRVNLSRESCRRVEGMVAIAVDECTGFRVVCRQTQRYQQNGVNLYKHYIVIEVDTKEILKPVFDQIQEDEELKLDLDYENFEDKLNLGDAPVVE